MQRIIKGDKVRITSGKFKGMEGTVLQVLPKTNQAIVEKVHLVKKHLKSGKDQKNQDGGIVETEAPLSLSKLTLVDPKDKGVYTKVSYQHDEKTHKKVRINRKTGLVINKAK